MRPISVVQDGFFPFSLGMLAQFLATGLAVAALELFAGAGDLDVATARGIIFVVLSALGYWAGVCVVSRQILNTTQAALDAIERRTDAVLRAGREQGDLAGTASVTRKGPGWEPSLYRFAIDTLPTTQGLWLSAMLAGGFGLSRPSPDNAFFWVFYGTLLCLLPLAALLAYWAIVLTTAELTLRALKSKRLLAGRLWAVIHLAATNHLTLELLSDIVPAVHTLRKEVGSRQAGLWRNLFHTGGKPTQMPPLRSI